MIRRTLSKIVKRAMCLGAILAAIIVAVGYGSGLLGLFMGMAIGLVNITLLAKDVSCMEREGNRARNKIIRNYFIRYAVMAALLIAYCGLLRGSVATCFLGLIVVQASTFWTGAVG